MMHTDQCPFYKMQLPLSMALFGVLFMVCGAAENHLAAIQLLEKHNPRELMGESHRAEAEPPLTSVIDGLPQSVGAADDKYTALSAWISLRVDQAGE